MWLRGSHVSLPTLSMQNFCGPLLPARREGNGRSEPREQHRATSGSLAGSSQPGSEGESSELQRKATRPEGPQLPFHWRLAAVALQLCQAAPLPLCSSPAPSTPCPAEEGGTRTNQLSKSANGQAARPRHKLQQPNPLLVVHLLDHLRPTNAEAVRPLRNRPGRGNGCGSSVAFRLPAPGARACSVCPAPQGPGRGRLTCQNHWTCLLFLV